MAIAVAENLPLCKHRYTLFVSYLGNRYNGSQRLVARESSGVQDTIQEALECSLEPIFPKKRCRLTGGSRTDKGVHALMNCFTLPLMDYQMPTERVKLLMNYNLMKAKHDIIANEVILAPADFHPRKCATSREYIYRIAVLNNYVQSRLVTSHSPAELNYKLPITEIYKVLPLPRFDLEKANEAINLLSGEHNFASFSIQAYPDEDTVRHLNISLTPATVNLIDKRKSDQFNFYDIHFKSRAFLHNQKVPTINTQKVRRLVGSIISFASYDRIKLSDIKKLLDNPNMNSWSSKILVADPWGLFLSRINYDKSSFQGAIITHLDNNEEDIDIISESDESRSDDENMRVRSMSVPI